MPGKLSDLAWMMFAPPVLAFVLSFATTGRAKGQRAAFVAAYAGLPLLYVAFNTICNLSTMWFCTCWGWVGGDGPRSPLDPTDSLVIPVAMAAAIWVWRKPSLDARSLRTRLALLAATAAALASVASTYDSNWGVNQVGRTEYGALVADTSRGSYRSLDGGLTWTKASEDFVPLEMRQFMELGEKEPSGIFSKGDIRITAHEVLSSGEVVYSFEYLQGGGNRWMQALDKRDIRDRAIATRPLDFFYDGQSGNLILAMGLQGVVVVAPDGTTTQGCRRPLFSNRLLILVSKTRTFFSSSSVRGECTCTTPGLAVLLAFSFAALALAASAASKCARWAIALAAAISAISGQSLWGCTPGTYRSTPLEARFRLESG